ncbi:MAG: hypothetical protein HYU66_25785, partial [Armatimonadetes bacterium]|nr:hypothetical protein [Armatimonadota bacterium]
MAERQPSWWDYTRAAFHFRVPLGGLGDIGVNYLCLASGAIFAGLFGIAHNFRASLGVMLLTSAFELAYLWFL